MTNNKLCNNNIQLFITKFNNHQLTCRRINREIIAEMYKTYSASVFQGRQPVFDGRQHLYTSQALPIGNQVVGTKCCIIHS